VLEGIGVVVKVHKNKIKWQNLLDLEAYLAKPVLQRMKSEQELKKRYHEMKQEEKTLDHLLQVMKKEL